MALARESSGTQTCAIDTVHTLASPTGAAARVLRLDFNHAAAGDVWEIYVETQVLSGGTARLQKLGTYSYRSEKIVETDPVTCIEGAAFKLQQTDGAGKDVPWEVCTLG